MIDTGIVIEMAVAAGETAPVAAWKKLKNCAAMPALIQPSTKIPTDYIGEEFTGEMLGKRAITGLTFTFAFDGTKQDSQFRFLMDADKNNTRHFLRVTYPEGTKFLLFVDVEVTLVPPTPSGEIDYTLAVTPVRTTKLEDLVQIVYDGEADPLASAA